MFFSLVLRNKKMSYILPSAILSATQTTSTLSDHLMIFCSVISSIFIRKFWSTVLKADKFIFSQLHPMITRTKLTKMRNFLMKNCFPKKLDLWDLKNRLFLYQQGFILEKLQLPTQWKESSIFSLAKLTYELICWEKCSFSWSCQW